MNKLITTLLITLAAISNAAQAETWRYAGVSEDILVYVDLDSIKPAVYPTNRNVTVSILNPHGEATLVPLEVNCRHQTIKMNGIWAGTNPTKHFGKLAALICSQLI